MGACFSDAWQETDSGQAVGLDCLKRMPSSSASLLARAHARTCTNCRFPGSWF